MKESSEPDTGATATEGAPLLVTIPEACAALRISRWSLYQLINKRRLKTVRIDRRRLIATIDLAALVEELRAEGADDGR
ncbi:MAG: helix-turn-helix domain-containing protein [Actinobacteria bacterium]|nr:helix-turn-helix domain-containing protein [Actinomycetota bacterium]